MISRIAETTLQDGKWISTVELDSLTRSLDVILDVLFDRAPGSFETMVFPREGIWQEIECVRYNSREEAIKGHEIVVHRYLRNLN